MKWLHGFFVALAAVWIAVFAGMLIVYMAEPAAGEERELIKLRKGDVDLLGRVIWAEARSESFEGQCAIAWIILNRLGREPGRFPPTIREVILQPYAFSCFNSNDPQCARVKSVSEEDPSFVQALHVATSVLTGRAPNPIGRADHYFVSNMKNPPGWARRMTLVKRLGAHSFFSERPVN